MGKGLKINKVFVLCFAVLVSLIFSLPLSANLSAFSSAAFSEVEAAFTSDAASTSLNQAVLTKSTIHHKIRSVRNSFVGFIKLPVQKLHVTNRLSEYSITHKKISYLFENKHTLIILYLQTLL